MASRSLAVVRNGLLDSQKELADLESIVEKHLKAFFEVGKALLRIRDEKLYLPEYDNFDDYCLIRWKFRRQHGYRLIEAAKVVDTLREVTDDVWEVVTSESQLRPLTKLDQVDDRRRAFKLALSWSKHFPPTARLVQAAASDVAKKTRLAQFKKGLAAAGKRSLAQKNGKAQSCQIIHGDSTQPKLVEAKTTDLILGSPPYNIGLTYPSSRDDLLYGSYLDRAEAWLKSFLIWAKPTGRLAIVVAIDTHKFGPRPLAADWIRLAISVGWKYQATLLWSEGSSRLWPNLDKRALAPQIATPGECVLVFYRETWERQSDVKPDISPVEYQQWSTGQWRIPGAHASEVGHPSPFPAELVRRLVKMFSLPGDRIVDPWSGSGTTILECAKLKRYAIGIDIEKKYCRMAEQKLAIAQSKISTKGNGRAPVKNK
jgi:site-specific DNA-methyltransferase (adenine-specific)